MPYRTDTEIDLTPKTTSKYIISSQHRKIGNPNKSIWTITFKDEIECFILSNTSHWTEGNIGWGLKLIGKIIQTLGLSSEKTELKLAKFIDASNNDIWHGYPADYIRKNQDRPGTNILKAWFDKGFIQKHQVIKIRKGIECNL